MNCRRRTVLIVLLSLLSMPALSVITHAELAPVMRSEIEHLLDYVAESGCEFYRNGTWHKDTKAAREHMELKYNYFSKRGKINSAEDFIEWAGTKSEISGKPYMVRCGDGSPVPASQWLSEELERYRRQKQIK